MRRILQNDPEHLTVKGIVCTVNNVCTFQSTTTVFEKTLPTITNTSILNGLRMAPSAQGTPEVDQENPTKGLVYV